MEDITDVDYMHTKRVCKDIKIKHMGEYCDSHVQNDVWSLDDAFENFWNMFLPIYLSSNLAMLVFLLD